MKWPETKPTKRQSDKDERRALWLRGRVGK